MLSNSGYEDWERYCGTVVGLAQASPFLIRSSTAAPLAIASTF